MRRVIAIVAGLLALVAVVAATASGDDPGGAGDGDYIVRGYFDNAGFLNDGMDVRIAGATVGSVAGVDVTRPGEPVTEDGAEDPGKAVVVMDITDAGFHGWLSDASCLIRPQSLLGEKYVDCVPTQPRAPGSEPPPALEQIPDGEIGAGEYRLPLENNGKQVDLDLVNNMTRQSEVDRFRLILNDLGAGLAARGEDLEEVVRRANPALQQTDKVLVQLAAQNRELAQLAADSDAILAPLSRERASLAGFIRNTAIAGEASAEERDNIALGIQRFPAALDELEATMIELRRFADAGIPIAENLGAAAPDLTGATRALQPFSKAGTGALTTLGDAAESAGPDLRASDPVVRDLTRLAEATAPGSKALKKTLSTFRKTKGIEYLMDFIVSTSNVVNGFDSYGHYLRSQIQITNCIDYVLTPVDGCRANWLTLPGTTSAQLPTADSVRGEAPADGDWNADGTIDRTDTVLGRGVAEMQAQLEAQADDGEGSSGGANTSAGNADLFKFLMGDGR